MFSNKSLRTKILLGIIAGSAISSIFYGAWLGGLFTVVLTYFLIRRPVAELSKLSALLTGDSSEVGSAVSKIFSVSQQLSQASAQQTLSVAKTAAAIEEISAMVRKTADSAAESEIVSSESRASAEKGKQVVGQMVHEMESISQSNRSIAQAIGESNRRIAEIVQVIQEIHSKTKVIDDIVFQTKLLSFNASVEAARAAEHGKGFAVVAEEVGNLARMSGSASKEISVLLDQSLKRVDAIVKNTQATIDGLISSSQSKVAQGSSVARECEAVLSQILENSTKTSEKFSQITVACQEQAAGVSEISTAIQQIELTTRVGSEAANESANAADALAQKVKSLRDSAGRLRMVVEAQVTIAKFRWAPEYELGVGAMDAEHKVLIEKMNVFALAMERTMKSGDMSESKVAFRDLVRYTQKHFSDEEAYLKSIGYPQFNEHKKIHQVLLEKVSVFAEQVENGTVDGAELMDFLNDWLMRHILGVDKRYAAFVDQGVEQGAALGFERGVA